MSTNETYDRIRRDKTKDKVLQQYNETRMKLLSEGYRPSFSLSSLLEGSEGKLLSEKDQEDLKLLRKNQRKVLDKISLSIAIIVILTTVLSTIL